MKTCPFCGSTDIKKPTLFPDHDDQCKSCGAVGPYRCRRGDTTWDTRAMPEEVRRHVATAISGAVEAYYGETK